MTLTDGRGARLPRTERRRQLLDAAQEVFVARGYHATAMDDIADRAGVSKPVLYQHFPGKLELYLALLDTHGAALVDTVRKAMESTTDNKFRVQAAMRAYFDFVDARGEAFRLVFESDLRNDPAVAERVDRVERDCGQAIAQTIMADTGVGRERADLLAIGLTGAAEMAARRWLASKRAVPKEEAVELLATLAWRGISRFPLQGEPESDPA
ncbi:TetR family transcriptional regulator [Stackebrandtia albiflava]|uniref:TetR family transcriptional regulator n=1 Tax=Stackebrandtia albiflava TaxID=406432 RepID=A0A562V4Z0_9ACTN|nr:TetR/AcrR family transcriptional regulator [Stackebrandtia albiflava]TWJ12892.1 TetR family transcriptional regulator [Stackebrandtia albiflava]